MEQDPIFNPANKVKTASIKWGKVGDWFKGTLVANDRQIENKLSKEKEMQTVYEFKVLGGQFHDIVEKVTSAEPTLLKAGEFWSVYGKKALQGQMRNAKLGQIIGMRYTEERKSSTPGFNPTKIVEVFLGEMDANYKGEQKGDGIDLGPSPF